jgi:hypothetical protein
MKTVGCEKLVVGSLAERVTAACQAPTDVVNPQLLPAHPVQRRLDDYQDREELGCLMILGDLADPSSSPCYAEQGRTGHPYF